MLTEYVRQLTGRPLVVIVLAPRPDVVAARDKVAYRDSFDGVEVLDRALREQTPRLGLWLDSSDLSATETVETIIRDGLDHGVVP